MASKWIVSIVFLVLVVKEMYCKSQCPTAENVITLDDIKNAAKLCGYVYEDRFKVGDRLPTTNFKIVMLEHDQFKDDEGFRVIVADNGNTRMIVYRGSDGTQQMVEQTLKHFVNLGGEEFTVNGKTTRVAKFFFNAFKLLQPKLKPYMKDPSRKYIITGHSLGGAMASLLALQMTQEYDGSVWKNPKSSLITFGQPRTGDSEYAALHDKLVSTWRKLRIVHQADPVTVIPPIIRWRHHSRAFYIGTDISGIDFSIWKRDVTDMDNSRSSNAFDKRFMFKRKAVWRICETGEAFRCSQRYEVVGFKFSDHSIASYLKMIEDPPSTFKNRVGDDKSSLTSAILSSC